MPERWTLHYAPRVIATIYRLRDQGVALREAIKDLETNPLPDDARALSNRPNTYEISVMGWWVIYQLREEEGVIRILVIDEIM